MALPRVSRTQTPVANDNAINSAITLLEQFPLLQQAVAAFVASLEQEQRDRVRNVNDILTSIGVLDARIDGNDGAIADVVNNLSSEQRDRVRNVNDILTSIGVLDARIDGNDGAITDIQSQVKGLRSTKLNAEDLEAETQARAAAVSALSADIATRATIATVEARRNEFTREAGRPGANPGAYTVVSALSSLAGDGLPLPAVPQGRIASGDAGQAVRFLGTGIVASRTAFAVEPGRTYRARYVVQRRANPSDPANDTVRLGIVWLDQSGNILGGGSAYSTAADINTLTTGSGRTERTALLSRSASAGQIQAPTGARAARLFVQCFGTDGLTDIEVLDLDGVTDAAVLAPETADTVQRVGALESENAGERLDAIEAQLQSPNSVTFATKSDAQAGTIPVTVTTVSLRGLDAPGDGLDGIFVRIAGTPPAGVDTFTNNGATFVRVLAAPALTLQALDALLDVLPTSPPDASRAWWNNSGQFARTP